MEQLSACIADRMIDLDIISSDDRDAYCYSVQGLLEKTICLTLIIVLAAFLHSLFEVIAFLSVFMLIRRSSDGIHCKTSVGCFCASTIMALSTIPLVTVLNKKSVILVGVICAIIVLCVIATFNNPDLNLSKEELDHLKKRSRITSLITGGIVTLLILLFPENKLVPYLVLGVIYNAISILTAVCIGRWSWSDGSEKT